MGLSRLDNFLKNSRGNTLYVDPSSIDATDSIENQGNSLARPFKTIQRALIEAARFSYQRGFDNDRFGRTSIIVYPGDHIIDNRPGWIPIHEAPVSGSNWRQRSGALSNDFSAFNLDSNFDVFDDNNDLYKFNSVYGGVIIPRGTSVVGLDLRKTKIRPRFVPDPTNDNITATSIFRVTGSCYFYQFTFFDADPASTVYNSYNTTKFVPNFSHHKVTAFEYADGANPVKFNDTFLTYSTDRTDLDLYYQKIGLAYGPSSGREISNDYPSPLIDIQPKVDEFRIVGSKGQDVGITSIKSGNGVTASTTITVDIEDIIPGIDVDTPIRIEGVPVSGYNGQYIIATVESPTRITYKTSTAPVNPLPTIVSGSPTLNIVVDTVTSSSPYIFNCSLRSVFGMCGLHADGSKADGFKSMVVAQFTGIGLQKDDNAFVKYNRSTGVYEDSTSVTNIHTNSSSLYKPSYESFHIKASNDAFLQLVSIFAIGYANHFLVESGGDHSITNSNSNFGAKALVARGFKRESFPRDDTGFITHIIPPKQIENSDVTIEFDAIDVGRTVGIASTSRLYLYNRTNPNDPPNHIVEGYRIGAKKDDSLHVLINNGNGTTQSLSARIVMPNTQNTGIYESTHRKVVHVGRTNAGINSIAADTLTFTTPHKFINGETIRIFSSTGELPDGLNHNQIYYAITNGVNTDQIQLAQTFNDTVTSDAISINNKGGILLVESRVSDKVSGDIGHPIQFDNSVGQWYLTVSGISTFNNLTPAVVGLGTTTLGSATSRSFIKRKPDTRVLTDKIYRARYVIPRDAVVVARPPQEGFVIQESNDTIGGTSAEILKYNSVDSVTLSNSSELRNYRLISNAIWDNLVGIATYTTEVPHELSIGSLVEIKNIKTTTNTTGVGNSGFNGYYEITSKPTRRTFTVGLTTNPGTFISNTSVRDENLPYYRRAKFNNTFVVYKTREIQEYVPNDKDGIYHLTLLSVSNSPNVVPFDGLKFSQPIKNLYPQLDRDNSDSDPPKATSFALPNPVGLVEINNPEYSITKETLVNKLHDFAVGFGLTDIQSSSGVAHTLYTRLDHGLNRITRVGIVSAGVNYGNGSGTDQTLYNARLVGFAGSTTGKYATANVKINSTGRITAVNIIDGGSAYGIGNTLAVVGIATTTGHIVGVVSVTEIYNNIGDCIAVEGVQGDTFKTYNNLYRITSINVGQEKQIQVSSSSTITADYEFIGSLPITGVNTNGLVSVNSDALIYTASYVSGRTLGISSITYTRTTGIASVSFVEPHGYYVDNKVKISGFNEGFYNGDFIVKKIHSVTSLDVFVGVSTISLGTTTTSGAYLFKPGFGAQGGFLSDNNERTSGRITPYYAGITTTLSVALTNPSTNVLTVGNALRLNLQVGDYLIINNEIMRVSSTVTSSTQINVFRGLFGSSKESHLINSVIRRVKFLPIEFRRNSILRASGHTFEYLGFGPGNYSTALPERQDRKFTDTERILSQAVSDDGGAPIYTGMDDRGNNYTVNAVTNSSTGQELLVNTPIPSVRGEDLTSDTTSIGFDVQSTSELTIERSLKVEGGNAGTIISEFNGPVIFNNKLSSNSDEGIEANSLYLQGDATISRKFTVGVSQPTLAGNPGDLVFYSDPHPGSTVGWVYTVENDWKEFAPIKNENGHFVGIFSGSFIGDGSALSSVSDIWVFDGVGISTTNNVGIETTSAKPGYSLYAAGPVLFENNVEFRSQSLLWNITNGFIVNTGITTFNQQLNVNTFRTVGVATFQNDVIVTTNPATTGDVSGNYLKFVQTDTAINASYFYGGILWDGNDAGNNGTRGYIRGESEGTSGQFAITFGTQGSGASNPQERLRLDSVGDVNVTNNLNVGVNIVAAGEITANSDERIKTNIKTIDNALEKVLQLRGVEYDRTDIEKHQIGVIAQEVEKVLPDVVLDGEKKSVAYGNMVAVLIEAIKEQQKQIETQGKQIEELLRRLDG
jgi:hypothetical protein